MRKLIAGILILSLVGIVLPSFTLAQVAPPESCTIKTNTRIGDCPGPGHEAIYSECYNGNSTTTCPGGVRGSICCVFSSLNYVINWIFFTLLIIAVILGVWGGVVIATAAGDPAKLEKGRNFIIFAIIGFAVAILARAIPTFAKLIMGV